MRARSPRFVLGCVGRSVDLENDVLGVLDKFANVNDLQKSRADLEPGYDGTNNAPDLKVTVANDVLFCLDAFTGAPYPFPPGDPSTPHPVAWRKIASICLSLSCSETAFPAQIKGEEARSTCFRGLGEATSRHGIADFSEKTRFCEIRTTAKQFQFNSNGRGLKRAG